MIIVGGTTTALMTAATLADKGVPVALFSSISILNSCTSCDPVRMNAALDLQNKGDSPQKHFEDTLKKGCFLANQDLVMQMCELAPSLINILDRMGLCFQRTAEGFLAPALQKGSRFPRCFSAKDHSRQVLHQLICGQVKYFENQGLIQLHETYDFLRLLLDPQGRCSGIIVQDNHSMDIQFVKADVVIVATSGSESIYGRYSASPNSSVTTLFHLVEQGVYFANPEMIEFSRDACRGFDKYYYSEDHSYDRNSLGNTNTAVATRSLGGLWTDEDHMTNVDGLFAVGECCYQYHGAQSLSGNLITADLFSGYHVAQTSLKYLSRVEELADSLSHEFYQLLLTKEKTKYEELLDLHGPENIHILRDELASDLIHNVGPKRSETSLKDCLLKMEELGDRFKNISVLDKSLWMNREVLSARQLNAELKMARLIVEAAICRSESRGVHFRSDCPESDDTNYLRTTKVEWLNNEPHVFFEDIDLKYLPQNPLSLRKKVS